jgi:hypothetical protein
MASGRRDSRFATPIVTVPEVTIASLPITPQRAPLQVVGVCGQAIGIVVNGAVVSFTCLPSDPGSHPPDPAPGVSPIFSPGTPLPPNVALVIDATELQPHLLSRVSHGQRIETFGIDVSPGSTIDRKELRRVLQSAQDAGQAPCFTVR